MQSALKDSNIAPLDERKALANRDIEPGDDVLGMQLNI
jgi:hypothetical protein